jgi:hypothetical protein
MRRSEPIRIETMPMRGTDLAGQVLREGTRHLVYRGPMRIGEIEETTVVHETGQGFGFHRCLMAMCLRDPECGYPTALLDNHFKTVTSAVKAIKHAEQNWLKCLPKAEGQQLRQRSNSGSKAKRP